VADTSKPQEAHEDHHDEADVERALKRKTQDGSGFTTEDELPESDFEGFAEEGVEMTEEDPK
jgi:hypothetical protein